MQITRTRMWLTLAACSLAALLTPKSMMAQIGPNSLQWTVDSDTVTNGSTSGETFTNPAGATITFSIALRGVSGNGGPTSYNCSFINASTGAVVYMPFSSSTTMDIQENGSTPAFSPGTYNSYCSATWSGNHVNGTVSTPFIQIVQH